MEDKDMKKIEDLISKLDDDKEVSVIEQLLGKTMEEQAHSMQELSMKIKSLLDGYDMVTITSVLAYVAVEVLMQSQVSIDSSLELLEANFSVQKAILDEKRKEE